MHQYSLRMVSRWKQTKMMPKCIISQHGVVHVNILNFWYRLGRCNWASATTNLNMPKTFTLFIEFEIIGMFYSFCLPMWLWARIHEVLFPSFFSINFQRKEKKKKYLLMHEILSSSRARNHFYQNLHNFFKLDTTFYRSSMWLFG